MICEIEIIAIAMEINISSNYTLWKSAYLQCTRNRSAKMEQVVLTRPKPPRELIFTVLLFKFRLPLTLNSVPALASNAP